RDGLRRDASAGHAGHGAAHPGAVRALARKALHPEPRTDRRCDPRGSRICAMSADAITAITMPKWGLTMTEGKVVGWLKEQGQIFSEGEELLEIETTKITNVVEAPAGGVLRRFLAFGGASVPGGALLAVVAASGSCAR